MKRNYFFYSGNDDVFFDALRDINNKEYREKNVFVRKEIYIKYDKKINTIKNKVTWKLRNWKLLNILNIVFSPWLKIKKDIETNGEKIFVFSNLTFRMLPYSLISNLLSRNDCKIIVYMLDNSQNPLCMESIYLCKKFKIAKVFTFDSDDAKKFDFEHIFYIYSKIYKNKRKVSNESKITFFGSDKGRLPIIIGILDQLNERDISYTFSVIGIEDNKINILRKYNNVKINAPVSYSKMIEQIQHSNILLDIVTKGQTGLSYRAIEAVCYNKKLLTNNPEIFNFPYYNPKFMQYFKEIKDIDWNFVTQNIFVDYKYKGEFSPVQFLKKLELELES